LVGVHRDIGGHMILKHNTLEIEITSGDLYIGPEKPESSDMESVFKNMDELDASSQQNVRLIEEKFKELWVEVLALYEKNL
jgi:hypothetical protein